MTAGRRVEQLGSNGHPRGHVRAKAIEWPSCHPSSDRSGSSSAERWPTIQALEQRSDEELEAEVKYKSAALAILGGRAAERFDAEKARALLPALDRRGAPAGTDADPAHGRCLAGARRAPARRAQGCRAAPRPGAALGAPDAGAARDGPAGAARERGHPRARARHPPDRGPGHRAAGPRPRRGRADLAALRRARDRAGRAARAVRGDRRAGRRGAGRAAAARSRAAVRAAAGRGEAPPACSGGRVLWLAEIHLLPAPCRLTRSA